MQVKTIQQQVGIDETVCEAAGEHIVECDVLMPDYLPDILKVVRVDAEHKLRDLRISGGRLTVEGNTVFKIMYVPQGEKGVKCFVHQEPFAKDLDVKASEDCKVAATLKTQYLNCRILNPRRAALRAVVSISANVTSVSSIALAQALEGDRKDIELLSSAVTVSEPVGTAQKTFKIFEDMDISKGKPAAADVLIAQAVVLPTDVKLIANKAVVKGNANVKVVYTAADDPSRLETVNYEIPFSQIIDFAGIDDGCKCLINFDVVENQTRIVEDPAGEGRIVSVELVVRADAKAYQDREIDVVTDAFSTMYPSALDVKTQKYERIAEAVDTEASVSETVSLPAQDIISVADVSGSAFVKQVVPTDEGIEVRGSLEVSVLAFTQNGELENIDRSLPFSVVRKVDADRADVTFAVENISYSLAGEDKIELRAQLRMRGLMIKSDNIVAVQSIEVNEQQPKDKNSLPTIVVYYPEKGEKIWDIAKKYGTAKADIILANKLEKEVVGTEKILLIPVKH